jgi:hypothetical protein
MGVGRVGRPRRKDPNSKQIQGGKVIFQESFFRRLEVKSKLEATFEPPLCFAGYFKDRRI